MANHIEYSFGPAPLMEMKVVFKDPNGKKWMQQGPVRKGWGGLPSDVQVFPQSGACPEGKECIQDGDFHYLTILIEPDDINGSDELEIPATRCYKEGSPKKDVYIFVAEVVDENNQKTSGRKRIGPKVKSAGGGE